MSTTSPHTQDFREQPAVGTEPAERGASPWLWALLILALVALPAWWWIRNSQEPMSAPATPAAETTATAQPLPEASNQRPATMVRHDAAPKPAVVRNRDARPLASNPVPAYPARALRSGVEGSVTARLQVDANGRVSDAEIVSRTGARDRDLDRAVLNTVRDWRFEPAMRNGRAVATTVQLPVDFRAAQQ
ncbi:energy transducer TonB [Stenotrophomonas sp. HITSZ_GD]|uniref:energy transducer TonB n=1 Tax=Stenotrophomonas sp. HITSZ_GD TaxID=3037248 RepID=UPI00240DD42A|nr:energy transducer TonB [Stenotrophomonas sp. HITSZ_GD]MDG2526610.1 energy transducer TonB [Stenotrophomonas sp. HITSZ_GD]